MQTLPLLLLFEIRLFYLKYNVCSKFPWDNEILPWISSRKVEFQTKRNQFNLKSKIDIRLESVPANIFKARDQRTRPNWGLKLADRVVRESLFKANHLLSSVDLSSNKLLFVPFDLFSHTPRLAFLGICFLTWASLSGSTIEAVVRDLIVYAAYNMPHFILYGPYYIG